MAHHERITIDCEPATPGFTAAYLRTAGAECAFIEAYTSHALPLLLGALQRTGRQPGDVRWVIVTHAHLDHAAGASALLEACPSAMLLAHPRAARHLVDPARLIASATSVYGADRFARLYGQIRPIDAARVRTLGDGESFALGDSTLQVFHTAGHANHHMVVDDPATDTVFTGDTFGLVYPALQRHGRFALASTSPTNFDASEARRSIARILELGRRSACPTHFGEVRDLDDIASQVSGWVDRAEEWVEQGANGDESVSVMTARLAGAWRQAIANEVTRRDLRFDRDAWKMLELDIDLNAQGLAFVADAKRKRMALLAPWQGLLF